MKKILLRLVDTTGSGLNDTSALPFFAVISDAVPRYFNTIVASCLPGSTGVSPTF